MPARGYEFYLRVVNSISHEWVQRTSEISSWPREDKIHIHKRACNILYVNYSDMLDIQNSGTQVEKVQNSTITRVKMFGSQGSSHRESKNIYKVLSYSSFTSLYFPSLHKVYITIILCASMQFLLLFRALTKHKKYNVTHWGKCSS